MPNPGVFQEMLAAMYVICFITALGAGFKYLSVLFLFLAFWYFRKSMICERKHLQRIKELECGETDSPEEGGES